MDIDATNLSALVQRQIFTDPSGGMINKRILTSLSLMLLNGADASDDEKKSVLDLLLVISLKLVAVWQHLDRYSRLEGKLLEQANANPIDQTQNVPVRIQTAQELYLEFDGFLVQLKSTLDHMVNILHFGLGLNYSSLTTFGDKGNKIVKILRANVAGHKKQVARKLIELIEGSQEWLALAIGIRDKMNHFQHGGLSTEAFTVFVRTVDSRNVVYTPRLSDKQTVREMMEVLQTNLIELVEVFVGMAMLPRLTKIGIKYERHSDTETIRWKMFPIEALRPLEKQSQPL